MKRIPPIVWLMASMLMINSTLLSKNLSNEINFTNPALSITIDSFKNVSCAGGLDGFAVASASGGVEPYIYLWSNGSPTAVNIGLSANVYTCTVTDFLGATAEASITISEPPQLNLSTLVQVNIDCINATGSAEVEASGGTEPYSYNWSTGATGSIETGLTTGAYTVTVTDDNGCIDIEVIVIVENLVQPIAVSLPTLEINCQNPTINLNGTGSSIGNFAYLWTTVDGNIVSGAATLNSCLVDAAGTYTLTVTDNDNGCTATANCVVTEDISLPTVDAGINFQLDCINPTATLDGSLSSQGVGFTYLWTTVDGNIVSGATTLNNCLIDAAGTYTLEVTNLTNGCTDTDDVSVSLNTTQPNADAGVSLQLDCLNPNIPLDGSLSSQGAGILYLWTTLDGNILSGATTINNCIVDATGTYTLLVTDSNNGCTASDDVVVTEDFTLPSVSAGANLQIDCNNTSVTLDGSASSQGSNYSYLWETIDGNIVSGSTTLNSCVVDAAGTYSLTINNSNNGCTSTDDVQVTANLTPPTAEAGVAVTIDCLNPTVILNGIGSSVGANITYNWTTLDGNITAGANTLTPTCDEAGTYTLTVTDGLNGCTASDDVVVTADVNLPTAQAAANVQIDCNNTTVTLDGSGSSIGANLGYLWVTLDGSIVSGSTTLNNCVVDAPGTYTLTVTNIVNGCSAESDAVVTSDTNVPSASASVNGQIDCDHSTLILDGNGSALGTNITYQWTTTVGNIISGATTLNNCEVDASGMYTLTVTNTDNGCTNTANVIVNANLTPPTAEAGVAVTIDCLNPTVILNGIGSSIGANITYNWTTLDGNITAGANTLTPTCDEAGTYTLTVTDGLNGCTASDDVVVNIDTSLPNANASVTGQIDCDNSTITLDGTGSATGANILYLWTTLDGSISSGATTLNNCTVDAGGTYTLTVTNTSNGCANTADVTLNSNTNMPTASALVLGQIDCSNASLVIDGSASSQGSNIVYLWTTINGNIVSGTNSHSPTVDAAGTYTLTVTDNDNGCTSSTNVSVTADTNLPIAEAGATVQIDCNNSTQILNGAGSSIGANISYQWITVDGNITAGATTLTPTCDQAGTYTLEVLNTSNGCTSTDDVTVTIDTNLPTANANVNGQIDCNTATLTLDGTGSAVGALISYNWTTSTGNILSGANTLNNCVIDAGGTYTLTVTNTLTGCTSTANITVNADLTNPTASTSVSGQIDCNNASVSLNGTGSSTGSNFTYLWTTTDGNISAGSNSINATATASGTYTLLVTDNNNGCTAESSVVVNADLNVPTAEAGGTVQINCNAATVMLNGVGSSVGSNISYQWTTLDGNITAGATTLTPTCDAAGTYTLEVTNNVNGCIATDDVVVTADLNTPSASASDTGQIDCLNASLTLDGSGSSSGSNIIYLWTTLDGNITSGANTLNNCVVDAGGTYSILVTNTSNGCTSTASIVVNADLTSPSASASVTGQIDCSNASLTLDGSGSSTGSNMTYLWTTTNGNIQSGANTLNNCVVDAAGVYSLLITNTDNGCTASANVSVSQDLNPPTAEAGVGATLTCALPTTVLNGVGSSIGSNISYQWTTIDGNITANATTLTPTVGAAGTYTLTVTDNNNGCTASDNVLVTADVTLPTANAAANINLDCNNASLTLDGTGSSTGPLFSYQWTTTNGNIVSGATTLNNCVVDAAGDYTLTISNSATGCTATANATVILDDTAPTASAIVNGQIDCDNINLVIDGSASSQGANMVYLWTTVNGNIVSGANTHSPTVDAAGTYTLTVTNNGNGCTSTTSATVTADTNLPTAEAGASVQIDCNNSIQVLNGVGSSVGVNISYQWTTTDGNITVGANTLTPTVNAAGTYTLTVSDMNNGCEASDNVLVTLNANVPNASASVNGQLDCNNSTLTLNGSGSASGANILYQWTTINGNIISGSSSLNNCVIDSPGLYTLTVTNSVNGCSNTASVVVTSDTNNPMASATVNGQIDCLNTLVTLNGSNSSQGANISYQWTTVNGNITIGANSMNATADAGGTYTLTVMDNGNGCTASSQVTVISDTNLPTAEAGATVQIDCNNSTQILNGVGSSIGANISYQWTTADGNITAGANTLTPTVDAGGTYTLTVSNSNNGCTNSDDVLVTVDTDVPSANASVAGQLDCITTMLTLSGTGSAVGANISYQWTTTDGNILSGASTLNNCIIDAPGTYNLLVTNTNTNCSSTANVVVTQDTNAPNAAASVNGQIDCGNPSLALDGNGSSQGGGIIYLWTTIDGNIVSGANTLNNCVVDAGGTYTLTVTNTLTGCEGVASVTVISNTDSPTAMASASGQIDCANTTVTLSGMGSSTGANMTYFWTTIDGNIVSGANTLNDCVVDAGGTYTLTVTDTSNGCTSSVSLNVNADLTAPIADAGLPAQLDCVNPSVILNGTGSSQGVNFEYEWTTVDGNIVSGHNTMTPLVNTAGTYTLTVLNIVNNCSSFDQVQVTQSLDFVNAVATVNGQLDCNNTTLTLNGNGSSTGQNISYLWVTTDGNIVSGANTLNDCVVDAAGTYTLTVTNNANGCSNSADATVSIDDEMPTAQATVNGAIGCLSATAILDGSGSSIGDCFEYEWTTVDGNIVSGQNSIIAICDVAGTYTLTITNLSNGMIDQISVEVEEIEGVDIQLTSQTNVDCFFNATGSATVTAVGGSSPFSYSWSNGATTATISNVSVGIYTVVITDANGCTNSLTVTINQPDAINIDVQVSHETATNANDGMASLSVSGGVAPFTYLWSNGATTNTITNLEPGNYSATVTDANGCDEVINITINPYGCDGISLDIQSQNPDCSNPNGGQISITPTGGSGNYTFEWSNGQTGSELTGVSAGIYSVIVTDENGCTTSASIEIELIGDLEPPTVSVQNATIYLDENGNASVNMTDIIVSATDDCGDVTIDFDTDFDCSHIGENSLIITVTDESGNTTTEEVSVTVVDNIAPIFVCPDDITVNTCDGPVYYEVPGLKDNCDEALDMILIEGMCPGSVFPVGTTQVTYAATDASGNVVSCTFNVTVESNLDLNVQYTEPTCHDFADATATVQALNGNIEDYKVLWTDDNNQTTATAENLAPGNYTVLVVDDNNCLISEKVSIPNPPELLVEVADIIHPNGPLAKGSIYINIIGGKAPYHVEWTMNGSITIEKEDLENVLPGDYTAMITDANGCTFWLDEITLGWEFQTLDLGNEGFKTNIFPSPTTGRIFLQVFQEEETPVTITIFNFIGQEVLRRETEVIGTADFDFDLTGMPSGQYTIQFNVDGKIENRNFVLTSW